MISGEQHDPTLQNESEKIEKKKVSFHFKNLKGRTFSKP